MNSLGARLKSFIIIISISGLFINISGCTSSNNNYSTSSEDLSYFQYKLSLPEHLYVIKRSNMTDSEATMIATLQGILAKSKPEIWIDPEFGNYSVWLDGIKKDYGINYEYVAGPWELLQLFKLKIDGYILYDKNTRGSLNVATSLAGILNAVAVEKNDEEKVKSLGLNLKIDVRNKDEKWLKENYWDKFRHDIVFEQKEELVDKLRDFAVFLGGFTFYDGNSEFRNEVVSSLQPDSIVMGWGDATSGEDIFVSMSSEHGVFTIAADHAYNLSVLSNLPRTILKQHHQEELTTELGVHYVTFIMSDGDNLQWNLGDFTSDSRWFGSNLRGSFNMGWGIPPLMADLSPSVVQWLYENATEKDYFVVGPSGNGYFYPSKYPAESLELHLKRLNEYMGKLDLHYVEVLDIGSFDNIDLWNKYTSLPNVDGIFYYEYSSPEYSGKILWSNGKPVVSNRKVLWGGITDERSLIDYLNNAKRDPYSEEGYTVVYVHAWSKSLTAVKNVIDNLDPHVKVVSPEIFMNLIQRNLRPHSYGIDTFEKDSEGWVEGNNGGPYDKAVWLQNGGNPGGCLFLDGSDLGHKDNIPNAWFSKEYFFPTNAYEFSFDVRSSDDFHGGELRVRVVDKNGKSTTLMDWTRIRSKKWVKKTLSLIPYRGKDVTICFEQNDSYDGIGEMLYIDNVEITVVGNTEKHNLFDSTSDNWFFSTKGGKYDFAGFNSDFGNPPGSIKLDGSDFGVSDHQANSWMYKTFILPEEATSLSFDIRSSDDKHGGEFRVLIKDAHNVTYILQEWNPIVSSKWQHKIYDISKFAGQIVTIFIEQGDKDNGIGEMLWIDNFLIE